MPKFEELSKKYSQFKFYKVNIDSSEELTKYCEVVSVPNFSIYLNVKKIASFTGFQQEKIEEVLNNIK
ncbi:Thioredoxin domain-containing protein 2, variant 2 [Bonamia ostreae]